MPSVKPNVPAALTPPNRGAVSRVFLLSGALLGLSYIAILPPLQAPDEFAHWFRAYNVSDGDCIAPDVAQIPLAVKHFSVQFPPHREAQGRISAAYVLRFLHAPLDDNKREGTWNSSINAYSCVPYIPSAVGIRAGRLFDLSPLALLYLSRLANLLAYLAVVVFALRLLPGFQIPMLAIALMPMALSQAASASWDGVAFSTAFFLCAYIMKLAWDPAIECLQPAHYAILGAAIILASLCKIDVWLACLIVFIPASRFGDARRKWLALLACGLLSLVVVFGWNYLNRQDIAIWIERIKDQHIQFSDNLAFIKDHPGLFVETFVRTLRINWHGYLVEFVGKLGWLVVALPGWIVWLYVILLAIAGLTDDPAARLKAGHRLLCLAVVAAASASIFVGMWCANTPVDYKDFVLHGDGVIPFVQGRYFIPFAFPLLLAISSGRLRVKRTWLLAAAAAVILVANAAAVQEIHATYYSGPWFGAAPETVDRTASAVPVTEVGPRLPNSPPEISAGWTPDGYYKDNGGPGAPPVEGPVFGSYPDANTGTLRLGPFHLDGHTDLAIPVVTGPQTRNLSLVVRDAVSKQILAELSPPAVREKWWLWHPQLPEREMTVELFAEDKGPGWGEWLAIAWPHTLRP